MTFRATNIVPQEAYRKVKITAAQVRANCTAFISQLSASGANYEFLRDIYLFLKNADASFDTLKTTPGLASYAQDQENDPTYDVAAEFTTMQAAIGSALSWMDNNVPTNVTAKSPADWNGGTMIDTSFTPAQTNGLQSALNSVVAAIS